MTRCVSSNVGWRCGARQAVAHRTGSLRILSSHVARSCVAMHNAACGCTLHRDARVLSF